MKVRYIGEKCISLTIGQIYEVLAIEHGMYRIWDDTDEDYLFFPDDFEVAEDSAPCDGKQKADL